MHSEIPLVESTDAMATTSSREHFITTDHSRLALNFPFSHAASSSAPLLTSHSSVFHFYYMLYFYTAPLSYDVFQRGILKGFNLLLLYPHIPIIYEVSFGFHALPMSSNPWFILRNSVQLSGVRTDSRHQRTREKSSAFSNPSPPCCLPVSPPWYLNKYGSQYTTAQL